MEIWIVSRGLIDECQVPSLDDSPIGAYDSELKAFEAIEALDDGLGRYWAIHYGPLNEHSESVHSYGQETWKSRLAQLRRPVEFRPLEEGDFEAIRKGAPEGLPKKIDENEWIAIDELKESMPSSKFYEKFMLGNWTMKDEYLTKPVDGSEASVINSKDCKIYTGSQGGGKTEALSEDIRRRGYK